MHKPLQGPATQKLKIAAAMACSVFCLAGAVNTGITGPLFAFPFFIALLFLADGSTRLHRIAAGTIIIAAVLYAGKTQCPRLYYYGIGSAVETTASTWIDRSSMLTCEVEIDDPSRAAQGRDRIQAAGKFTIVDVQRTGGIDAPVKYQAVVEALGRRVMVANIEVIDGHAWNYSCLRADANIGVRAWSRIPSRLMWWPAGPLLILGLGSHI